MRRNFDGRVYKKDVRDLNYKIKVKKDSKRTSRYWNGGLVFNQGNQPTCVAWAWSGWLYAPPVGGQFLNPLGLYAFAQSLDGIKSAHDGTTVRAAAKVLQSLGLISEYRWATNLNDVVQTLLEVSTVVAGTSWYLGMSEPTAEGIITPTGKLQGGHAYRLDGVNTDTGMLRMINNWSSKWGKNGRASISFEDFEKLMKANGEVCLAIESDPLKFAVAS